MVNYKFRESLWLVRVLRMSPPPPLTLFSYFSLLVVPWQRDFTRNSNEIISVTNDGRILTKDSPKKNMTFVTLIIRFICGAHFSRVFYWLETIVSSDFDWKIKRQNISLCIEKIRKLLAANTTDDVCVVQLRTKKKKTKQNQMWYLKSIVWSSFGTNSQGVDTKLICVQPKHFAICSFVI